MPASKREVGEEYVIEPPVPLDETVRLKSLHSLKILDTQPEERFDRITRMAQRYFNVDICLIRICNSWTVISRIVNPVPISIIIVDRITHISDTVIIYI